MQGLERIDKIVDDMVDVKADLENDIKSRDARNLPNFMTFMHITLCAQYRQKIAAIFGIKNLNSCFAIKSKALVHSFIKL